MRRLIKKLIDWLFGRSKKMPSETHNEPKRGRWSIQPDRILARRRRERQESKLRRKKTKQKQRRAKK